MIRVNAAGGYSQGAWIDHKKRASRMLTLFYVRRVTGRNTRLLTAKKPAKTSSTGSPGPPQAGISGATGMSAMPSACTLR
jgi:hypothetical protein